MNVLDNFHQALQHQYDIHERQSLFRIIISHILKIPYHQVNTFQSYPFHEVQYTKFQEIVQRLQQHEPIQYILQQAHFMGLDVYVNPHVLIPRPETEELVQMIVETHQSQQNISILDLGTGSGCIPLALKKQLPQAQITGIDISEEALKVAKSNADHLKLDVNFLLHDILNLQLTEKFDVMVSNPPYIHLNEAAQMEPQVLQHEPHLALFVKHENPIIFYEKIIAFAKSNLKNRGQLYFEINPLFSSELLASCTHHGLHSAQIIKDMQGKSRFLTAQKME